MPPILHPRLRPLLPGITVAVASLMWGAWWLPLRWLEAQGLAGDWSTVGLGSACSLILIVPLLRRRRRLASQAWPLLAVGLLSGCGFAAWNHAILTGDVIRVTLLFYLAPVWGTLLAILFLGQRLTRWRALSVVFGLAGAMVVLGSVIPVPHAGSEWMALGSGMSFAAAAAVIARVGTLGNVEKNFASLSGTALFGLVFLVGDRIGSGIAVAPPSLGPSGLVALAALAAVMLVLQAMLLWGAGKLDSGRFTVLLLFEVISATVTASLAMGALPGWRESLGCLLILGCGLMDAIDQRQAGTVAAGGGA